MGNQNTILKNKMDSTNQRQRQTKSGLIFGRLRRKKNKLKSAKSSSEEFIVKLHREQIKNGILNEPQNQIAMFDKRRVVFVSLIGLFQTWKNCPSNILFSSIIMLPIKKKWIYHP
eukprot:238418_1